MSIRVLIADDEPKLAEYLAERLAALWPGVEVCDTAANGEEALAKIQEQKPDVAFLDIKMPGMSGLEVARKISHPCLVVFVTAYHKYAVDAFEEEAVDYLLKPVNDERLKRTIARIQERQAGKSGGRSLETLLSKLARTVERKDDYVRYFRASSGKVTRLISACDVLFIRAHSKYTLVITKEGEFLMRLSLSQLIKQLDPEQFWQIHRSTIVNASKVISLMQRGREEHVLRIRDHDELLPVSRSFLHLFKQM
jgi:DNA-binding LytR/AlgR family response regulator